MPCKSVSNDRAIIRLYTKRLRWISVLLYSYPEKKANFQLFHCFLRFNFIPGMSPYKSHVEAFDMSIICCQLNDNL